MKTDKIDKDIQKLRDKISDLQGQLKAKERQKTDMENTEIVGMVRNLGVRPEDLAAYIKAFQAQQPVAETVSPEPIVEDAVAAATEQPEEPAATAEPDSSYSTTNDYSSTSYDYNSDAERRYSFEESDD